MSSVLNVNAELKYILEYWPIVFDDVNVYSHFWNQPYNLVYILCLVNIVMWQQTDLRWTHCSVSLASRRLCLRSSLKRWEEKPLQRSMFPRPSSCNHTIKHTHTHTHTSDCRAKIHRRHSSSVIPGLHGQTVSICVSPWQRAEERSAELFFWPMNGRSTSDIHPMLSTTL